MASTLENYLLKRAMNGATDPNEDPNDPTQLWKQPLNAGSRYGSVPTPTTSAMAMPFEPTPEPAPTPFQPPPSAGLGPDETPPAPLPPQGAFEGPDVMPPTAGPTAGGPTAGPPAGRGHTPGQTREQDIAGAYQYYLGRQATPADLQSWIGNDNFNEEIANSPEARKRRGEGAPGAPGAPSAPATRKGWSGGPSDPATYSGGNGKLPGYTGPTTAVDPAQWKQFTADLGIGQDKGDHQAVRTLADRLRAAGYAVEDGPISDTGQLDSLYINGQLVRVFDSSGAWNYQPDVAGSPAWDMPGEGGGEDGSDPSPSRTTDAPGGTADWRNPQPLPFRGPGVTFFDSPSGGAPAPSRSTVAEMPSSASVAGSSVAPTPQTAQPPSRLMAPRTTAPTGAPGGMNSLVQMLLQRAMQNQTGRS